MTNPHFKVSLSPGDRTAFFISQREQARIRIMGSILGLKPGAFVYRWELWLIALDLDITIDYLNNLIEGLDKLAEDDAELDGRGRDTAVMLWLAITERR